MEKKIAILQSNYIPWKGYFDIINMADTFVFYDEMQYTKNDWRNRNKIKTKNGVEWLTIPVRVKSLSDKISDIETIHPKWRKKHWNTLKTNYGKAPYFKKYSEIFEALYLDSKSNNLSEINQIFIREICDILKIDTEFINSNHFELCTDRNERLIYICEKLSATNYISGPSAKDYMNLQLFENANISIEFINYESYKEYNQIHGDFEHYVTILDLIFNEGEKAKDYLISNQK